MKKIALLVLMLFLLISFNQIRVFSYESETCEQSAYSYIRITWWENSFNDDILTNYIIKSVQNNYDLKIAALKVRETTENKNLIRAGEMPEIGIGAIPALYKLPSGTNSEGLISLPSFANYELDLFGKNRDKTKSMDKSVDIARQNERANYFSIVSAVGSTYFNIVKLDKLIEIQNKIIKQREEIYTLMKLSNEEGLISLADTINAYKAYIKGKTDIIEYKKLREHMLNMLAVLIGDSPENSINYERISYEDIKITKSPPDYISSTIIENRPDYLSAEKRIEKAGIDVRVAKKEFLPSFNIFGLLSFNSTKYFSKLNWTNSASILGEGIIFPFFTGGAKIANLKLNKNKYEQALENYKNINIKAIQELNDFLYDLKLDNEKYYKTLEIYNAEKQNFYYTNLKYTQGVISKLDLLQKQELMFSAEKLLVIDKIKILTDYIGLYKASAGEI